MIAVNRLVLFTKTATVDFHGGHFHWATKEGQKEVEVATVLMGWLRLFGVASVKNGF
jgi:phage host-nuclease inhibitor protein Gam